MQQPLAEQFLTDIENLMLTKLADLKDNDDWSTKEVKELVGLFTKLIEAKQLSKQLFSTESGLNNDKIELSAEDKAIMLRHLLPEKNKKNNTKK